MPNNVAEKEHIVVNIDTVDINNCILFVVEYVKGESFPTNVYPISSYDEIDDKTVFDFSNFPKIDENKINEEDEYDRHAKAIQLFEEAYLNGQKVLNVYVPIYQIIGYFQKELNQQVCSEDFENEHLIEYTKSKFHIEFPKEQQMIQQSNIKGNFLGEIMLENYRKERLERLGF